MGYWEHDGLDSIEARDNSGERREPEIVDLSGVAEGGQDDSDWDEEDGWDEELDSDEEGDWDEDEDYEEDEDS